MYRVNSGKTVRRLAGRSFRAGKTRNFIAAAAVALTTVLFTTLFTVGSGMVENIQKQNMRMAGGDGMGVLKYITEEEYGRVKDHELIEEITYNRMMCEAVENVELLKRHGELYYMDDAGIRLGFAEPVGGHKPEAANEIMMDTETIRLFGMEQKVGAPVTLELVVHGEKVERDFVLSGWWKADPAFNVSLMVTSRAYMEEHREELYNSYKQDANMTGVINSYVMFDSSWGLEGKMERLITESGYSTREGDANYMENNVNWAYLSAGFTMDLPTVAGVAAALLLIMFTGYLIIYNIFQISVLKDIRFYGLLKTIGMTGKQMKGIIRYQVFWLSCMGIPAGLAAGYFLGNGLVPLLMGLGGNYRGDSYDAVKTNPWIFAGSVLFALATVFISAAKPGRMAAKVSPVEAVTYTDGAVGGRRRRKSGKGAGPAKMAAANLGRNKTRTVLVVLSMALSLILFNTVYTLSIGFDMDKYLSTFVDTDFLIAHADYFNYSYRGPENSLSESMIGAVMQQEGFAEGGRLYSNPRDVEVFRVETEEKAGEAGKYEKRDDKGDMFCTLYGLEDLPLERLWVLEGEIDMEKLKTGKYILEGIQLDDHQIPKWETSHYEIGDTVVLHNYKGDGETAEENEYMTYSFEVMAKVAIKYYTNSTMVHDIYSFYLPAEIYKGMTANPGVMSYAFNVKEGEEASMETFLENYTGRTEKVMNYSSKMRRAAEFENLRNMVLVVGGALSFIIGLIGILNFVNSVLTSILTRKREFAMLQSIGMTTAQLRKMLMMEGIYYTAAAGGVSLALGALCSTVIVRGLAGAMWFFSYRFTVLPLCMVIPVLLAAGSGLPVLVLQVVGGQSIVERLRETDG